MSTKLYKPRKPKPPHSLCCGMTSTCRFQVSSHWQVRFLNDRAYPRTSVFLPIILFLTVKNITKTHCLKSSLTFLHYFVFIPFYNYHDHWQRCLQSSENLSTRRSWQKAQAQVLTAADGEIAAAAAPDWGSMSPKLLCSTF